MSQGQQVEAYSAVDSIKVGELFKTYSHLVLGLSLHYLRDKALAEDAVMDIFESLLQNHSFLDAKSFKPWLLKVTRNHCLKKIERCLSRDKSEELEEKHLFIMENQSNLGGNNESLFLQLEDALKTLSTQQQECVSLFYYKEMSYSEIAMATSFSIKEVKSYLQNAKEKMKRYMLKQLKK